jgi:hypothetical protein
MAKAVELKLKVGDVAPPFAAPTQTGETVSLDAFRGPEHRLSRRPWSGRRRRSA